MFIWSIHRSDRGYLRCRYPMTYFVFPHYTCCQLCKRLICLSFNKFCLVNMFLFSCSWFSYFSLLWGKLSYCQFYGLCTPHKDSIVRYFSVWYIDLLVDMVIYMLVLVWCTVSHDIIAYIIYLYAFALSCQP